MFNYDDSHNNYYPTAHLTKAIRKMFDLLVYENNEDKLKFAAKDLGYKTMNAYKDFLKK